MSDRKAVNKYYPPDWDPSKGTINQYIGQHPLRERARKLDQGILIIRFEMPFNVFCLSCKRHISRGVRFNAEKRKIGNYFRTPILEFRMKCPSCSSVILIKTDPKNAEYEIISGAKRQLDESIENQEENYENSLSHSRLGFSKENIKNEEEIEQRRADPFAMLEQSNQDKVVSQEKLPEIFSLIQDSQIKYKDPFVNSFLLRKKFRNEKQRIEEEKKIIEEKKNRGEIPQYDLLSPSQEDTINARNILNQKKSLANFHNQKLKQLASKKARIKSESIFAGSNSYRNSTNQSKNQLLQKIRKQIDLKKFKINGKSIVSLNMNKK
ncbi:coiled-coil domain-containing protein [Anaeramoeba ignava]|uniref:Coiled-coil domain-containing protein n=1 Tax=Anaeramoeba ignava TaxID=1746090 RepID=A0A9Q0L4Y7_ANAIG|nr:coiled-coil domain-containing protein [Anaeramoeba ignava]